MNIDGMNRIRAIARQVAARVKADQAFREEVQRDPVGILIAAGLPEQVIDDFLRETGLSDVSGYLFNTLPLSQVCTLTVS